MKKLLLLAAVLMPLAPFAHADISIEGDNFKLGDDCVRIDSDNVSIKSDKCSSGKHDKDHKGNASIHGDDNPGQGHDKGKKDKKK